MDTWTWWTTPLRRRLAGGVVTAGGVALAVGALMPLRSSITEETAALILVVPVATGVAVGGIAVAPLGIVLGFLTFDVFFIPPYGTLRVSAGYHWVTLVVYGLVSLVIGGVVAQLYRARDVAESREAELRVFYELAEVVARASGLQAALEAVAELAAEMFMLSTVALLVYEGDPARLRVVTVKGEPLAPDELRAIVERGPFAAMLPLGLSGLMVGGIGTAEQPLGVLAIRPVPPDQETTRLLEVFGAQAGVVVERARLADESARASNLAEVDRLRSALMRSVSHDLRTPLASIKASVSDLADEAIHFDPQDRKVLLATIEEETDRLTRFVTNLLDMTRIESGALRIDRSATPLEELVEGVLVRLGRQLTGPVVLHLAEDLPLVDVDYTLIDQVLVNLVENVIRHCPAGTAISISAVAGDGWVEVRVADDGPGVAGADQERIFNLFYRGAASGGGGTGLGLAICAGVIAAHDGQLWVERNVDGGSTFAFRVPTAPLASTDDLVTGSLVPHRALEAGEQR